MFIPTWLLAVILIVVALLWQRVTRVEQWRRRVEERATNREHSDEIDAQEFLRRMRDYHLGRFPQLKESHDSIEAADALASALSTERPSLRRVLIFSMWMSRDFVRNVVGITDAELDEIKDHVAEVRVWPTFDMRIEEWDTHTVVFDHSGYRKTIYQAAPWKGVMSPHVVWHHTFGKGVDGPNKGGSLEIVLHDDAIKCWARDGRFKGKYWSSESEDKYVFITIPLKQDQLNRFLRPDDADETVSLQYRYVSTAWDKQYVDNQDNADTGWSLQILDKLA